MLPVTSPVTLPDTLPVTLPVRSPVTSPVTSPVRSPTKPPVEVVTPETLSCPPTVRPLAPKVKSALSSIAPDVPARTTRPLVRSETIAEARVASPATSRVPFRSAAPPIVAPAETLTVEELTLVTEMSASRATSTPLEAALVVTFAPPVIASASFRRLICSEPESPVTVSAVPTAAVVADVMRPFASTVITGTSVCEP